MDQKEGVCAAQAGLHQNVYFVLVAGCDVGESFFVHWDEAVVRSSAAAMSGRNRARNSVRFSLPCNFLSAAGSERM